MNNKYLKPFALSGLSLALSLGFAGCGEMYDELLPPGYEQQQQQPPQPTTPPRPGFGSALPGDAKFRRFLYLQNPEQDGQGGEIVYHEYLMSGRVQLKTVDANTTLDAYVQVFLFDSGVYQVLYREYLQTWKEGKMVDKTLSHRKFVNGLWFEENSQAQFQNLGLANLSTSAIKPGANPEPVVMFPLNSTLKVRMWYRRSNFDPRTEKAALPFSE